MHPGKACARLLAIYLAPGCRQPIGHASKRLSGPLAGAVVGPKRLAAVAAGDDVLA
jgi:hypothetical protein